MGTDNPSLITVLALFVLSGSGMVSCTSEPRRGFPPHASDGTPMTLEPTDGAAFDAMLDDIRDRRVVFVGEIHDRYDHHINQLNLIRGLKERGADLAIGMEHFQEPFQRYLDDYVAGGIDERAMLTKTEYYGRWRYDFRLYRDILEYARDTGIPLIALNAPGEMVEAVSRGGIDGLSPAERARLPAHIEPVDEAYEQRLRTAFELHGDLPEERFARFMEVQSVWDEYMAKRAADYLLRNPQKTLVVLAGSAHVLHDAAIPQRLRRRLPIDQAVVVTRPFDPLPGVSPDYIIASRNLELEQRGRLGMRLQDGDTGVTVERIKPDSRAYQSGFRAGDRLALIEGIRIDDLEGVRLALHDHRPGDHLQVVVERKPPGGPTQRLNRVLLLL